MVAAKGLDFEVFDNTRLAHWAGVDGGGRGQGLIKHHFRACLVALGPRGKAHWSWSASCKPLSVSDLAPWASPKGPTCRSGLFKAVVTRKVKWQSAIPSVAVNSGGRKLRRFPQFS